MCGKWHGNCIEGNLEVGTWTAMTDGYSALDAIASLPLNFVHHQTTEGAKLIFFVGCVHPASQLHNLALTRGTLSVLIYIHLQHPPCEHFPDWKYLENSRTGLYSSLSPAFTPSWRPCLQPPCQVYTQGGIHETIVCLQLRGAVISTIRDIEIAISNQNNGLSNTMSWGQ